MDSNSTIDMNTVRLVRAFLLESSAQKLDSDIQAIVDALHDDTGTTETTHTEQVEVEAVDRKRFTKSDIEKVWQEYIGTSDESICPLCGENRIIFSDRLTWEMAHIKAHAEGGSSDLSNIRPLCFTCNRSMGVKHIRAYLTERYPERYHIVMTQLRLTP